MSSIKLKKPLAWLLTLVMILSMLPAMSLNAFAADAAATDPWLTYSTDKKTITKFNYEAGASPAEITIPATKDGVTITTIAANAFAGCGLTKVEFESGSAITTIGASAFQGNLFTEITLPTSVTSLGAGCFQDCSKLTGIDLSGLSLTAIPVNCFFRCASLISATLPEGLTTIDANAFYNCSLNGIVIPSSVTTINGDATFSGMKADSALDLANHAPGNIAGAPWFAHSTVVRWADDTNTASNDCFIFNSTTGMICGLKESITADSVTTYFNKGALTIPAKINGVDVKGLADGAFGSRPANTVIKSVTFAPGCAITAIPNNAFLNCTKMTAITGIPEGVTAVGDYAFRACMALTDITLPATLQTVGSLAFYEDSALTRVTFSGNALTSISTYNTGAFGNCNALKNIHITQMDKDTFNGAPWGANYAAVEWKNGDTPAQIIVDSTGDWEYMPSIGTIVKYVGTITEGMDLTVPSTLSDGTTSTNTTIVGTANTNVVPNGSKLNKVTISDGIKTISSSAFYEVKIPNLDLGKTIEAIGTAAFYNSGLTSLVLPDTIQSIDDSTFASNALTGQIVIPGNATYVAGNAFKINAGITSFLVKQYRDQASDGAYNDALKKYLKSPANVKNNAPFGMAELGDQVYFMDDPRPVPTYTVTVDAAANAATINLSVHTNKSSHIITNITSTSGTVTDKALETNDGLIPSTAKMTVAATSGNGTYTFNLPFANKATPANTKDYPYFVPMDVFHTLQYNGNGSTSGVVLANANYVNGYTVTLDTCADVGSIKKTDCIFLGWSKTPVATVTSIAEQQAANILPATYDVDASDPETITLYAVWGENKNNDDVPDYLVGRYIIYNAPDKDSGTTPLDETKYNTGDRATINGNIGNLTRAGYTFAGWEDKDTGNVYNSGDYYQFDNDSAVLSKTVNLYAKWRSNGYAVEYNANGGTGTQADNNVYAVSASATIKDTGTIARTGFTFTGWNTEPNGSGTPYAVGESIILTPAVVGADETLKLYAQWSKDPVSTNKVTYDLGDFTTGTAPTDTNDYAEGALVTVKDAPARTGFTFVGWKSSHNGMTLQAGNTFDMPAAPVTLTAVWAADDEKYNVTYDYDGGTKTGTGSLTDVVVGTYVTVDSATTAPTNSGKTFTGWRSSFGGATYQPGEIFAMPGVGVTLTAQWADPEATYTVTYVFSGDVPAGVLAPTDNTTYGWHDSVTVEADATTTEITKNGVPGTWAFDGWTTTADLTNGIEGNVVYTGTWTFTPDKIDVTFNAGTNGKFTTTNDPLAAQTIDAGTTVGGVPAINANGSYTFLGWEIVGGDGTRYSNAAVVAMKLIASTTFTAAYQQTTTPGGGGTTTYYTLSFQENGGSALTPVSATSGTVIDLGKYTTRTGYTFEGWYADEVLTQPISSVKLTKNTVVYAKWSFNGGLNTEDHFAYVVGYSDGTVRPNANISRAETATMLYLLLTAERRDAIFTSSNSFTDVSRDLWYNKAVSSMANGGYIQGYEDGTFGGSRSITRAEFVAMVVRFLGTTNGTASFNDVSTSHWAYKYIATATSAGWINGYTDGSFKPEQAITRAEAMAIINRVLDRGTDKDGVMTGFKAWPDNQSGAWYYYEVIEATNAHEYDGTRPSEDWTSLTTDYSYDIAKYERP